MMATVPHVTICLGLRKFQADGFLLTRVYLCNHWIMLNSSACWFFGVPIAALSFVITRVAGKRSRSSEAFCCVVQLWVP